MAKKRGINRRGYSLKPYKRALLAAEALLTAMQASSRDHNRLTMAGIELERALSGLRS